MPLSQLKDIFKQKDQIEFLQDMDYDLEANVEDPHPKTETFLIHDAVLHDQIDMVQLLIEQKVDLNRPDEREDGACHRRAPLFLAILRHNTKIATLLLKNRADVNACDLGGKSPLMLAAVLGETKTVNLLLKAKANINQENIGGGRDGFPDHTTPLLYAVFSSNNHVASLLVKKGAALANSKDKTVLDYCDPSITDKMTTILQPLIQETQAVLIYLQALHFPSELATLIGSYTQGFPLIQKEKPLTLSVSESKESTQCKQKEQSSRAKPYTQLAPRGQWCTVRNWAEFFSTPSPSSLAKSQVSQHKTFPLPNSK